MEIRPVENKKDLETFLRVPWALGMKKDPNWVPPLLDDYRRILDPKKSPFLKHGEASCFLALEDGEAVGGKKRRRPLRLPRPRKPGGGCGAAFPGPRGKGQKKKALAAARAVHARL